jgi:hypothetical protein
MLLISLDDSDMGVAIIKGVSYRVTGRASLHDRVGWPATADNQTITIELRVTASLDEEQQRRRIERLEYELQEERERLEEIKRLAAGEPDPVDSH